MLVRSTSPLLLGDPTHAAMRAAAQTHKVRCGRMRRAHATAAPLPPSAPPHRIHTMLSPQNSDQCYQFPHKTSSCHSEDASFTCHLAQTAARVMALRAFTCVQPREIAVQSAH